MVTLDGWLEDAEALLRATRSQNLDATKRQAVAATARALAAGRPLLVCGNGGSAADAEHIVSELVGRFLRDRPAMKAISLAVNPAVLTAWSNDHGFDAVFSRQVEAYGEAGGVLFAISTSGNSRNVIAALEAARGLRMNPIGLSRAGGGQVAGLCDFLFRRAEHLHSGDSAGSSLPLSLFLRSPRRADRYC